MALWYRFPEILGRFLLRVIGLGKHFRGTALFLSSHPAFNELSELA
jgi:hypothetical protein